MFNDPYSTVGLVLKHLKRDSKIILTELYTSISAVLAIFPSLQDKMSAVLCAYKC